MLQSSATKGFLAIDTDDTRLTGDGLRTYTATTDRTPSQEHPVATVRNAWILHPVPSNADLLWMKNNRASDQNALCLHYGQHFVLRSVRELFPSAESGNQIGVVLSSTPKTHAAMASISKNQEVYFAETKGHNADHLSVWIARHPSHEYRVEMDGKPIQAGDPVLLFHQLTNVPLASTLNHRYTNDFGIEFEVSCHRYLENAVKGGRAPEQESNIWSFVISM